MKYICKCDIKRYAKATCTDMIDVPTFKTCPSGYQGQNTEKVFDNIIRYCSNGTCWCPHQVIVEQAEKEAGSECDVA